MKIHFENVGRGKKSWTSEITHISSVILMREINAHHALASRCVDFEFDEDGKSGIVLVGGWRPVGKFTLDGAVSLGTIQLGGMRPDVL